MSTTLEALADPALPWLPRLFVLVALPLALAMALLFPLGEGPDEATQVARAASVLHGQWIGHRQVVAHPWDGTPATVAGVEIDPGYLAPLLALPSLPLEARKPVPPDAVRDAVSRGWAGGTAFVEASNTAGYMPLFYLPAAVGMGLAAIVSASPRETVLAARVANALCCVLLGCASLHLARRGRPGLFAVLVLPMTLHLCSVVNQDGPLVAAAALAAALLPQPGRRRWLGVAALACVIAAKPPYLPLAALVLVPLGGEAWQVRRHGLGFVVAVLPGLAWAGLAAALATVPFLRPPYHPGPLWDGPDTVFNATDPAAQLRLLLHRPSLLLRLPVQTLAATWRPLISSAVGVLAHLDFNLPAWLYRLWYVALAAAALATAIVVPGGGKDAAAGARAWTYPVAAAAVAACLLGLFLLQYLAWTEVGHATIDGVQGRYLLPVLALLVPMVPPMRLPDWGGGWMRPALTVPAVAMAVCGLGLIPVLITLRYGMG